MAAWTTACTGKDRVKIAQGADHLRENRLKPDSPTRRAVASYCGSSMFLDFIHGHWLTVFRDSLSGHAPELQMGIMTKGRPKGLGLPNAIPACDTQSARQVKAAPHAGGIFSNFGRAGSTWSQAWPRMP
jgi:hypothetical protein